MTISRATTSSLLQQADEVSQKCLTTNLVLRESASESKVQQIALKGLEGITTVYRPATPFEDFPTDTPFGISSIKDLELTLIFYEINETYPSDKEKKELSDLIEQIFTIGRPDAPNEVKEKLELIHANLELDEIERAFALDAVIRKAYFPDEPLPNHFNLDQLRLEQMIIINKYNFLKKQNVTNSAMIASAEWIKEFKKEIGNFKCKEPTPFNTPYVLDEIPHQRHDNPLSRRMIAIQFVVQSIASATHKKLCGSDLENYPNPNFTEKYNLGNYVHDLDIESRIKINRFFQKLLFSLDLEFRDLPNDEGEYFIKIKGAEHTLESASTLFAEKIKSFLKNTSLNIKIPLDEIIYFLHCKFLDAKDDRISLKNHLWEYIAPFMPILEAPISCLEPRQVDHIIATLHLENIENIAEKILIHLEKIQSDDIPLNIYVTRTIHLLEAMLSNYNDDSIEIKPILELYKKNSLQEIDEYLLIKECIDEANKNIKNEFEIYMHKYPVADAPWRKFVSKELEPTLFDESPKALSKPINKLPYPELDLLSYSDGPALLKTKQELFFKLNQLANSLFQADSEDYKQFMIEAWNKMMHVSVEAYEKHIHDREEPIELDEQRLNLTSSSVRPQCSHKTKNRIDVMISYIKTIESLLLIDNLKATEGWNSILSTESIELKISSILEMLKLISINFMPNNH